MHIDESISCSDQITHESTGGIDCCPRLWAGFDSCAHMCEETKGADSSAPYAIVCSIVASAVLGYVLLIGMLMSIQVGPVHCLM